jgi:hypothetical protein
MYDIRALHVLDSKTGAGQDGHIGEIIFDRDKFAYAKSRVLSV